MSNISKQRVRLTLSERTLTAINAMSTLSTKWVKRKVTPGDVLDALIELASLETWACVRKQINRQAAAQGGIRPMSNELREFKKLVDQWSDRLTHKQYLTVLHEINLWSDDILCEEEFWPDHGVEEVA